MSLWEAIVLGVVQGLTEFLPISSTAHLLAVRAMLGHEHPEDTFTVVIQLGTLVAVFAYFRADVVRLLRGLAADVRNLRVGSNPDGREAWLILLGTIPAVVVGALFNKQLKQYFFNLPAVAGVATVFALLLAASDWWARRRASARDESSIGWRDALWVGLWQACALMPGASRSGTTITGGLFAGLNRTAAARFSFLLSLPVILAAGLKELYDEYKKLQSSDGPPSLFASGDDLTALIVGTLVSAVVGYLSIGWLLGYLKGHTTTVFVAYRLILGAVLFGLILAGVIR
jgi:undecaprenyl-diphosphatase